jgi:glucose-6-phosphate isomerase
MQKITLDEQYLENKPNYEEYIEKIQEIVGQMEDKKNSPEEYLGWLELPTQYDKDEFARIKTLGNNIYKKADAVVIIGIGGSYLGARSAIEALTFSDDNAPEIYYLGINVNASYLENILKKLEGKEVYVNVISKSGTTLEPALSFRIVKEFLKENYGTENLQERIIITTDKEKGALKELADKENYETFIVPDNVGGRYSVLTAVGLLPMAMAGINIDEIMQGAQEAQQEYSKPLAENDCYKYAINRHLLYQQGKKIEILASYNPFLEQTAGWWKQLFGESEGKEGKGIFPAAVSYTTELHSLGQYIQEGERHIFETVLNIENDNNETTVPTAESDADNLNYLAGKKISRIEDAIQEAVIKAHTKGGVPNLVVNIPELNAHYLGQLYYFFEKACAVSAQLLEVDPFNQPGVEAYKKEMTKLLGELN